MLNNWRTNFIVYLIAVKKCKICNSFTYYVSFVYYKLHFFHRKIKIKLFNETSDFDQDQIHLYILITKCLSPLFILFLHFSLHIFVKFSLNLLVVIWWRKLKVWFLKTKNCFKKDWQLVHEQIQASALTVKVKHLLKKQIFRKFKQILLPSEHSWVKNLRTSPLTTFLWDSKINITLPKGVLFRLAAYRPKNEFLNDPNNALLLIHAEMQKFKRKVHRRRLWDCNERFCLT